MDSTTRKVALAAAASLASAGILVPQAQAAPTKVKSGRTTLTITAKSKKSMKRQHVKLAAGKPGSTKSRTYRLPLKSGKFDFKTNRGTLNHSGSLRLKRGRRTVMIRGLQLTLGKKSWLVATVAGSRITLGVLSRKHQKVKTSGGNRTVERITLRFSAKAVKRINKKLGGRVFSSRKTLGSLSVRVRKPASKGSGTGASRTPTRSEAKLAFAPGISQALQAAGLTPSALPGTEQLPDGTISLPVAGATIDAKTGSATIDLAGGIVLGSGANAVTIDRPQILVGGTDQGLYASVNGARVKLANLDQSGLQEALKGGVKQFSDLLVSLSPDGAAALNQAGGVSLFVPGTPLGDIDLTLPGS
jgi:hypothetical protein